ncbi:MAG: hypothetical protein H7831_09790, partial [Magnetococcus sp. WYHC-3]
MVEGTSPEGDFLDIVTPIRNGALRQADFESHGPDLPAGQSLEKKNPWRIRVMMVTFSIRRRRPWMVTTPKEAYFLT